MSDRLDARGTDRIVLVAQITAAYVSNNRVPPVELPDLVCTVHAALAELSAGSADSGEPAVHKPTPAQIRRSITHDALRSFEDGRLYKTLRRHLNLRELTPEAYRAKWGLPRDYPMTAAGYSERRSALAMSHGLGRIGGRVEPKPAPAIESPTPKKPRGRKSSRSTTK